MKYKTWSFRNADSLLSMKFDRRRELEQMLDDLPGSHPIENPHGRIRTGLANLGWNKAKLILRELAKIQTFDSYDDRIAVEIEFSRYEFVYRDYFRFMLSYSLDQIDLGVLIVFTDETKMYYNNPNIAPSFENCIKELPSLESIIGVPILVIGLQ